MNSKDYVSWFRDSTPYISAHRQKTFVVLLSSEAIAHATLTNIVHDLALLHVLGARLVVVHGSRVQVDAEMPNAVFVGDRRVTDAAAMQTIARINGQIRTQLEALFSMGLPATPMHNTDINVVSGNFVTARPIGVIDGVDHVYTGRIRKVHAKRIHTMLDSRALVLLPPMGFSPSGQAFNLAAHELATETAIALEAEKLIVFDERTYLTQGDGRRRGTLQPGEVDAFLDGCSDTTRVHVESLARAVRAGVGRGHLLGFSEDGALLGELFTAAGVGTQISESGGGAVRPATSRDVADIVEIIRPLEESGALVRRSRDRLEREIDRFFVAEVDGIVVGTCALYPHEDQGELACVAVKQSFQSSRTLNIGSRLVQTVEAAARAAGLNRLFILTTQAEDWFREHGFALADLSVLPMEHRLLYNYQRASKVMIKQLS
jgi:amino-acid N-acetyltransferase